MQGATTVALCFFLSIPEKQRLPEKLTPTPEKVPHAK